MFRTHELGHIGQNLGHIRHDLVHISHDLSHIGEEGFPSDDLEMRAKDEGAHGLEDVLVGYSVHRNI